MFAVSFSLFIAEPALVSVSWLHLLAVAYMGQQSPVLSKVQIGWCLVFTFRCYMLLANLVESIVPASVPAL